MAKSNESSDVAMKFMSYYQYWNIYEYREADLMDTILTPVLPRRFRAERPMLCRVIMEKIVGLDSLIECGLEGRCRLRLVEILSLIEILVVD
jgi:hypothetical protein